MSEELKQNREVNLPIRIDADMERRTFLKTTVVSPMLRGLSASNVASICKATTEGVTTVMNIGRPKLLSKLAQQSLKENFGVEGMRIIAAGDAGMMQGLRLCRAELDFTLRTILRSLESDIDSNVHCLVFDAIGESRMDDVKMIAKDMIDGCRDESMETWYERTINTIAGMPETYERVECFIGEGIICEIYERASRCLSQDVQRMIQRKNLNRLQLGKDGIEVSHPLEVAARAIAEAFLQSGTNFNDYNYGDEERRYGEISQLLHTENHLAEAVTELTTQSDIRDQFLFALGKSIDRYMTASDFIVEDMDDLMNEALEKLGRRFKGDEELCTEVSGTAQEVITSITAPWNRVLNQIRILGSETERPSTAYLPQTSPALPDDSSTPTHCHTNQTPSPESLL